MKYEDELLTRIRCVWDICWGLNTINLQLDESIGNIHVNLTLSKGNQYKTSASPSPYSAHNF